MNLSRQCNTCIIKVVFKIVIMWELIIMYSQITIVTGVIFALRALYEVHTYSVRRTYVQYTSYNVQCTKYIRKVYVVVNYNVYMMFSYNPWNVSIVSHTMHLHCTSYMKIHFMPYRLSRTWTRHMNLLHCTSTTMHDVHCTL